MVPVKMKKFKRPNRLTLKITLSAIAYRVLVDEAERQLMTKSQYLDLMLRNVEKKQEQETANVEDANRAQ